MNAGEVICIIMGCSYTSDCYHIRACSVATSLGYNTVSSQS